MADITRTKAQVSLTRDLIQSETFEGIAGEALEAGQVVYMNTSTGQWHVADASAIATAAAGGIALNDADPKGPVTIAKRGFLEGYTLTDQDYWDALYLSVTAGAMADAAPTGSGEVVVQIGRVLSTSEDTSPLDKLVYVDFDYTETLAAI